MCNLTNVLTFPNLLTTMRIVLSPLFALFFFWGPEYYFLAFVTFTFSALTDTCDGYWARRYGSVSNLGIFLDPIADKILVTTVFLSFAFVGLVPWFVFWAIFIRDFIVTILRIRMLYKLGCCFGASKLGKCKTVCQFLLVYLLFLIHVLREYWEPLLYGKFLLVFIHALLYAITLVTLYSGFLYIRKYVTRFYGIKLSLTEDLPGWQHKNMNTHYFALGWLVSTGCYIGFLPVMPGTFASFAVVVLLFMVPPLSFALHAAGLFGLFVIGTFAADFIAKHIGKKDPQFIVIDEMVGMLIALMLIPHDWRWYLAAFIIFRIFDISKYCIIGWAERNIPGGLGIMVDDVIAGGLTFIIIQLCNKIL